MDIISTYGVGYYGQARYNNIEIYESLDVSVIVSTYIRSNKSPIIINTIKNKPLIETNKDNIKINYTINNPIMSSQSDKITINNIRDIPQISL